MNNSANQLEEMVKTICERLDRDHDKLQQAWLSSTPVQHFVIDDLLSSDWANEIHRGFPELEKLTRFDSIRERKSSSAAMAEWGESTRNCFRALQDPRVLTRMSSITGIKNLQGDLRAYAGGISAMREGDFLNPHLDNSTHPLIKGYRRLNALFYVTPDWSLENGGNLELWAKKLQNRKEIVSAFNRLVVMNTNRESLHSVNRVKRKDDLRKCVSNYYFSPESPLGYEYHHITSFRGRPGERLKDLYLRAEGVIGSLIQAIRGKPLKK